MLAFGAALFGTRPRTLHLFSASTRKSRLVFQISRAGPSRKKKHWRKPLGKSCTNGAGKDVRLCATVREKTAATVEQTGPPWRHGIGRKKTSIHGGRNKQHPDGGDDIIEKSILLRNDMMALSEIRDASFELRQNHFGRKIRKHTSYRAVAQSS
jgi:hypothetical protein